MKCADLAKVGYVEWNSFKLMAMVSYAIRGSRYFSRNLTTWLEMDCFSKK